MLSVSIGIMVKDINKQGYSAWMWPRCEKGSLNDLLEFPGGKIETGESPVDAMHRELKEEVQFCESFKTLKALGKYTHRYSDRSVEIHPFILEVENFNHPKGAWYFIEYDGPLRCLDKKILEANKKIILDLSKVLSEYNQ